MTRTPSHPIVERLANGVTVICDPLPGFDTLALSVVAGRGARHESAAEAGWSHLLEHMVFKGAGRRSARTIVEDIESVGGQLNAATGHERTSFQARMLAGGLPLAVEIIADLVLRPTLAPEDLVREKRVVAQEIAEAADIPDDQVFELAQAAAFADQPLGRPILGTIESLEGADSASLGAWRTRLYAPDRLVISAAGAVDANAIRAMALETFGEACAAASDVAPACFTPGVAASARRLEQAHLVFLLPGPAVGAPDYFAARLFAEMLGGGMSSRLFQEARETLGLAYAIDAYAEAYADVGVIGVYAGCAASDAAPLARVTAGEIAALATSGGEPAELARAKAQLKASLFMARESLAARAEQAAAQWLAFGRLLSPAELAEAIDQVSAEAVAAFATGLVAGRRAAVASLGPKRAGGSAAAFNEALFGRAFGA